MADDLSVGDWLDQFNDLDAYLAEGGRLLDLPVSALDMVPASIVQRMVKRMTLERLRQGSGFRERFADRTEDDAAPVDQPTQPASPAEQIESVDETRAA